MLYTRKDKLRYKIEQELMQPIPNIDKILFHFYNFEKNNIDTIEKLKRDRKVDIRKINGAIKQTLNDHPNFNKNLIGSMGKRIYGSMLQQKKENIFKRFLNCFK
jgi:hypothetical protein